MKRDPDVLRLYWICVVNVLKQRYGMAQKAVAEYLRVSPQFLSDIKKGRKTLSEEMVARTAETFGFSWDDVAQAVPPKWQDYWLFTRPDPEEIKDSEEGRLKRRDRKNLLSLILTQPIPGFPPLKLGNAMDGLALMEPAPATAVSLPLLTRPTVGDPRRASSYLGEDIPVGGHAARWAARARHPYLLSFLGEDPEGRMTPGDVLLVDQNRDYEAEHPVRVVKVADSLCLARHRPEAYQRLGSAAGTPIPHELVGAVAGLVVAIVWSEVR